LTHQIHQLLYVFGNAVEVRFDMTALAAPTNQRQIALSRFESMYFDLCYDRYGGVFPRIY